MRPHLCQQHRRFAGIMCVYVRSIMYTDTYRHPGGAISLSDFVFAAQSRRPGSTAVDRGIHVAEGLRYFVVLVQSQWGFFLFFLSTRTVTSGHNTMTRILQRMFYLSRYDASLDGRRMHAHHWNVVLHAVKSRKPARPTSQETRCLLWLRSKN